MRRICAWIVAGMLFTASLLTGCQSKQRPYTKSEIKAYIKEELCLDDFEILDSENDETSDKVIWTVRDNEYDLEFIVVDISYKESDLSWEWKRKLVNNYSYICFGEVIFDEEHSKFELTWEESSDGWEYCKITAYYRNREELTELYEEILRYKDVSSKMDTEISVGFFAYYSPEEIDKFKIPVRSIGLSNTNLSHDEDEIYVEWFGSFFETVLAYNLEDELCKMTEDDFQTFEESCPPKLAQKNDKREIVKEYDIYGQYTYSNLYKLLIEEGFEVEGDECHYKVKGIEGQEIEISYDFVEVDGDNYDCLIYVDGKARYVRNSIYIVYKQDIEKWFGLKLEFISTKQK